MKKWNGSKWIRRERRQAIYNRDGFVCLYCNRTDQKITLSLDHIIPRSLGGNNKSNNLITACKPCNSARGNKPIKQFRPELMPIIRRIQKG